MKSKLFSALFVAAALTACLSVSAFAETYYIDQGDIVLTAKNGKQYVTQSGQSITEKEQTTETIITQTGGSSPTSYTITITAEANQTATVTLSGVDIDVSDAIKAALSTSGAGDVTVKLSGCNTLASGSNHAGLEKVNTGKLTISGTSIKTDSLTATSRLCGAGIGGGEDGNGSHITISGGKIIATGGYSGAGIGGGNGGSGSHITISGGEVIATTAGRAAGIGGGNKSSGSYITITGGTVTATGGGESAGIGGGCDGGSGSHITISGGTVKATGGYNAAGIGGGEYQGGGENITISGGVVTATGGDYGAGIGGGCQGGGNNITISGGVVTATGGDYGAGIGGGAFGSGNNIRVWGDAQLKVRGGKGKIGNPNEGKSSLSAGCAIGDASKRSDGTDAYDLLVKEEELDTTGLMTNGWIKYYKPGADMSSGNPEKITYGTVPVSEAKSGTTNYRVIHTYVEGEGTVDPEGDIMVRDGKDKTITFTPAAGYEIGDIVVNHKSVGAVSEYTVKDISGTVNIEVTFVKSGNAVVGTENAKNPSTGAAF